MALDIFLGSAANLSAWQLRELLKVLHKGEALILTPFSTTLDFIVLGHFKFES